MGPTKCDLSRYGLQALYSRVFCTNNENLVWGWITIPKCSAHAGKRLVKVWDKTTYLLALPLSESVEESAARHFRYYRTSTLYFKRVSYSVYVLVQW